MRLIEEILQFWFEDSVEDVTAAQRRFAWWFGADDETDRRVRVRYHPLLGQAARGELSDWRQDPAGALAEILVLDQFPRNIYRGEAAAFAYDEQAASAAQAAVARGHSRQLPVVQAGFLLMPLQHAENHAAQAESVAEYQALLARAQGPWRKVAANFLEHARKHRAIIERFGRFPHRNMILGRPDTPLERRYLHEEGSEYADQVRRPSSSPGG